MRALSFRPNGENGRFRAEDGRGGKRLRGKKAGLTRRHGDTEGKILRGKPEFLAEIRRGDFTQRRNVRNGGRD